jgi:hypothetical protein
VATIYGCTLCQTLPATYTQKDLQTLCRCGFELQYHTLAHPHGFTGGTPGCSGFQRPSYARELPLFPAAAGGTE